MIYTPTRSRGLRLAIKRAGSIRALADMLGITSKSIVEWYRVPPRRVAQVAAATGLREEQVSDESTETRNEEAG
jgi:DNA-binding transcriptional regulator YdaS (Cro superfamily)